MAMLKLSPFGGMFPRTGIRLLPDTAAQVAYNLKLQSGEFRPLGKPQYTTKPASPKTSPPLAIFRARSGTEAPAWFTWPIDVDCVRVPLGTDVESRFCWTGDGAPKTIKFTDAISGSGNNYPLLANELMLGIPAPQVAPTVTPSGGSGSAVTRFYCYTYVSQYGEESAPSPFSTETVGKVDDTWAITAMDVAPPNSGVGTAAYTSVTTFTATAAAKHFLRVGDSVVLSDVSPAVLVTTTVASVPSPTTFTVAGDYNTAVSWVRSTAWNTASMVKRVYRTSGTTGEFQLVNDPDIAVATTSYNDTLVDTLIAGDELISTGWVPPPVGLRGLAVHPSGALVGFINNLLCFSEPLQPHAWPVALQLSSGFSGVGIALFGTSVVMATAGVPYVATGVEPASMTGEDIPGMYPCLSKRSVLSIGSDVVYASKHGLVQIGAQGLRIFTEQFYTRDEWSDLLPTTMVCETANGRLYLRRENLAGVAEVLVFDGQVLVGASADVTELYTDPATGDLYVTDLNGIYLWDSPSSVLYSGQWKSKEFVFPAPVNLGAAKVDYDLAVNPAVFAANAAAAVVAAAYNVTISAANIQGSKNSRGLNVKTVNGSNFVSVPPNPVSNELTFNLYCGSTLIVTRLVNTSAVFRLPAGKKYDNVSVEIISQCAIKEIRVAETPDGLRAG